MCVDGTKRVGGAQSLSTLSAARCVVVIKSEIAWSADETVSEILQKRNLGKDAKLHFNCCNVNVGGWVGGWVANYILH